MPGVRRALPIIAALALVSGVAGCGSSNDDKDKIPSDLANKLLQPLDAAQQNAATGQCTAVQSNAKDFAQEVAAIGATEIDPAIKKKLVEASENLKNLAVSDDSAVSDCTQPPTGASGAQGSTDTGDSSVADNTTTTSTPEVPASDESPPTATGEPANAKPTTPAAPATDTKPTKVTKPAPDRGQNQNGPPGPAGNPNHSAANSDSGGVSPRSGG